ncbi:hypothetical protein BU15DRAFT_62607 [Melanogaster broomeanus]|nr:hypothetical protein BU15DRAFT_62607 [Melanogaster broomeanus]
MRACQSTDPSCVYRIRFGHRLEWEILDFIGNKHFQITDDTTQYNAGKFHFFQTSFFLILRNLPFPIPVAIVPLWGGGSSRHAGRLYKSVISGPEENPTTLRRSANKNHRHAPGLGDKPDSARLPWPDMPAHGDMMPVSSNYWLADAGFEVEQETIPSKDGPTCVLYNSRGAVDPFLEDIRRTGRIDSFTFGQKRDPCTSIFRKIFGVFFPSKENTNISIGVTLAANPPGLHNTVTSSGVGSSGVDARGSQSVDFMLRLFSSKACTVQRWHNNDTWTGHRLRGSPWLSDGLYICNWTFLLIWRHNRQSRDGRSLPGAPVEFLDVVPAKGANHRGNGRTGTFTRKVEVQHALDSARLETVDEAAPVSVEGSIRGTSGRMAVLTRGAVEADDNVVGLEISPLHSQTYSRTCQDHDATVGWQEFVRAAYYTGTRVTWGYEGTLLAWHEVDRKTIQRLIRNQLITSESGQPPQKWTLRIVDSTKIMNFVLFHSHGHPITLSTWRVKGHDLCSIRVLGSVDEPYNPEGWNRYNGYVGGEVLADQNGLHHRHSLPWGHRNQAQVVNLPFFGIEMAIPDPLIAKVFLWRFFNDNCAWESGSVCHKYIQQIQDKYLTLITKLSNTNKG